MLPIDTRAVLRNTIILFAAGMLMATAVFS